jgi:thiol-disulfide isomerase/thioredoxin
MKLFITLIAFAFILFSCSVQKISKEIIIEGQVDKLPNGKVYLTDVLYRQIPLDSAESINGHFIFTIKPDSLFVPYMASINYHDAASPAGIGSLAFSNDFIFPPDTTQFYNYYWTAFYLERGKTRIFNQEQVKGEHGFAIPVKIKAGRETELMYRHQNTGFGFIGNTDTAKRYLRIEYYKKQIKASPFSYYLLQNIYNSKEAYTKDELQAMLSLFDKDVQKSALGEGVRIYLGSWLNPDKPYPNLLLLDANSNRQPVMDSKAKLNMLVFWASWCGPCRMEIPTLKEIQAEYAGKGLNLVSISIDENMDKWKQAMQEEQMHWPQYIVDSAKIETVRQQFDFDGIPLVLFTDNKGKQIMRFMGYGKDGKQHYESVINKFIRSTR